MAERFRGNSSVDLVRTAIVHGLFWLVIGNAVGVLLAGVLVFPRLNDWLGEYLYGRWMPVHLNVHLFGWTSMPLVAWLIDVFYVERSRAAAWGRSVICLWSFALLLGILTWLSGDSSGKIFLDWVGVSRVCFPLALSALWLLLTVSWWDQRRVFSVVGRRVRALGLLFLFVVPVAVYWASGRAVYPPVNPDTGGPTGISLLASTLVVVLLLLVLPLAQGVRTSAGRNRRCRLCWGVFLAELLLVVILGDRHASHHALRQWVSLGSLTVWIVLIPLYYGAFEWTTRWHRWRNAWLCWFGALVATGWLSFLPGVLDSVKFTNALVAHSHLAMAGFVTSFNVFLIASLRPQFAELLERPSAFWVWHGSTAAYVVMMWLVGGLEAYHPAEFTHPSLARRALYAGRLLCGLGMLGASAIWLRGLSHAERETIQE